MKWAVRIGIVAAVSAAMAVGLSLLPQLEQSGGQGTVESWSGKRAAQMTERNMVDLLVQVPLQLRIRKVELNHSIVSIDLSLPKNAEPEAVYRDLYRLTQTMTTRTTNINQVLVRVLDYTGATDTASGQLVLALEAGRGEAKDMEPDAGALSQTEMEAQLQNRFHITYTMKWRQRYPL
ncbi:hypothetical protein B5M42_015490 [Paenibacillus athensensis]|uniref:Uncharacterized protein n=1 Tax=Paenibacillus athensensis TaxID=1967502 RepID=A0A4Y8Q7W0_9BACL|nr:hypothetical protein [Paenibacillus athensensis]MCD1260214.1 hypothetical protein [Paenibacillus athensensis]